MALPSKAELQQLNFSLDGSIFCKVTAKPSINADSLEYSLDGSIWWGHGGEGGTPPEPVGFMMYVGELQVQKAFFNGIEIPVAALGSIQF